MTVIRRIRRNQRGQALIPLVLVLILVIAIIGIFAFEVTRATMIRDQLRSAAEAAALGGTAALAGSALLDPADSQTQAIDAAKSILARNDIFGVPLRLETDFANQPEPGHTKVKLEYLDPKNNNAVVPIGDPKAKVLKVTVKQGFQPIFAGMTGIGGTVSSIEAAATGGVGDLDIVLVFDVSGSMDDETLMSDVRRSWDPAQGKVVYTTIAKGKLAFQHSAVPPLQMGGGFNAALRGPQEAGTPPGNFPPGTAGLTGFTDTVVNLDEQNSFTSFSADGFDFPSVAALVEASRGNLENAGVFHSSEADTTLGGIVTPKAGYKAEYLKLAKAHTHPLVEAQAAAKDFFTLMNKNANAHFGIVAFDDQFGNSANFSLTQPSVGPSFPQGGNSPVPLPSISLQKAEAQTNFTDVINSVDPLVAFGGTNIGGGTNKAIDMFATGGRDNAKKAVIVFTDGEPTNGGPLSGDPFANCRLAAQKAKQKGIAIFTVGLALNPGLLPIQQQVLGDNTATGMAAIAGNGGRFFPVTQASNLRAAFANIARHLSSLVD
jgi:Flp pilus assembly protein TadG